MKVTYKSFSLFMLFLYFVASFAHQLGTGFDALFVRATFVLFVGSALFEGKKVKLTKGLIWSLLFWGWYFMTILWGHNTSDSMRYVNEAIQVVALMVCIPLVVRDREDINLILKYVVVAMLYTSILLLLRTPRSVWGTERFGSQLGLNPNILGINTALASAICWHFVHEKCTFLGIRSRRAKAAVCILMILLFAYINMLTGSKKGIFSLVFCIVLYEMAITRNWKLILKVAALALGVYVVLYLIFNNATLYTILGRRIERMLLTMQGEAFGADVDNSYNERQYFIRRAKALFTVNPLFGYGANNFMSYIRNVGYYHVAYSHNNFWELLSTLGVVGFAIYYYYWVRTELKLVARFVKQDDHMVLLFAVIFLNQIIMDYAMVSYIVVFMYVLLECGSRLLNMPNPDK